MDKNTQFNIIVKSLAGQMLFWDSYRYDEIRNELPIIEKSGSEIVGFLSTDSARSHHDCNQSALYGNLAGYTDKLQNEETELLDSEQYIVCWYSFDGEDMEHMVDYGISKQEIMDNVRSQKYVEGALYIPETALLSLADIEKTLGIVHAKAQTKESNIQISDPHVAASLNDIVLKGELKFRYMMLDRMRTDCEYYLGYGGRCAKHLWAGTEKDHIACMKILWNHFKQDQKPEWLTYDKILEYEQKMVPEKMPLNQQIQAASNAKFAGDPPFGTAPEKFSERD